MEFAATFLTTIAVFAVEFPAFVAVVLATLVVAGRLAELRGATFPACRIFPTALLADFLRYDGDGALFAFLLFALAVVGVFFALLAREEFLAFGLGAAA